MNAQNNKNLLVKLMLAFIFILFLSIHSFGETKKQELIGLIRSLNSDYNFLWEKHTLSEQELRSFTIEKNKLAHNNFSKISLNGIFNKFIYEARERGIFTKIKKISELKKQNSKIVLYNNKAPEFIKFAPLLLSLSYLFKFELYKSAEKKNWDAFSNLCDIWIKALAHFENSFSLLDKLDLNYFLIQNKYIIPIKNLRDIKRSLYNSGILYTSGSSGCSEKYFPIIKKSVMLEIDLLARCIMAYTHKFRKTPDSLNRLTEIFNQLPLKNSDDRKTKYSCDGKNFTLIADIYFNDKKYTIKRSYSFPEYNQKN